MSKEDKKSGCNCKGQKQINDTVEYLRSVNSFDGELYEGNYLWNKTKTVVLIIIGVILLPILFIGIMGSVIYTKLRYGNGKVDLNPLIRIIHKE